MRISCRVRAWHCLSALLGLSLLSGCGGSDTTSAPPPPPPPVASAPTPDMAPDPAQSADAGANGGDGYVPPGMEEQNSGMGGMPNSGMAGMGGMGGMGMSSSSGEVAPAGMSPDYGAMTSSMAGPGGGGTAGIESIGGPGMMGMSPGMGGMGGMGGAAFVDPAPADDADYLAKAKYAFAIGKESAAEQYVIAEMLANEAEAANLLQQVRFSMALRKPALTLRFGVAVSLEAASTITDYKPIGRYANANGQGGGGEPMGMMSGGGMPGGAQAGGAQKTLGDLTGNFGDEFIKSFEGAWDSGSFGSIFADVEPIAPRNRLNPNGGNNRMMGMASGMPGMSPGGMGMESFGGEGMPGMGGGGEAAPSDEALRLKATPGKPVVPGLTYLGTGKEPELLGKAETEGLDYLFLFEVKVEMKRRGQQQIVNNDSKLRLLSVKETSKDKRTLGSTSTLNNLKIDYDTKGDNDDVAKNLGNLFRKVETIKLQEMPKMKPESAQARVKSLIEKKTKDVLPILMEIKLYHSQGLLNDEERDAAYQLTLPNGLAFANGSPEDRAFVLDPMLPGYK